MCYIHDMLEICFFIQLFRVFFLWTQGYDNVGVTIDELPPPFSEEESKSNKLNNTTPCETSTVDDTPTVIVIPTTNEGPNSSSA